MNKEIKSLLDHLYWFYNANMSDIENQKDYKKSLRKLKKLIKKI